MRCSKVLHAICFCGWFGFVVPPKLTCTTWTCQFFCTALFALTVKSSNTEEGVKLWADKKCCCSGGLNIFDEYNSSSVYRHSDRLDSVVNLRDNEEPRDLFEFISRPAWAAIIAFTNSLYRCSTLKIALPLDY